MAKAIYKAMKGLFLDATLHKETQGSNSPDVDGTFDPPAPTVTDYTCKVVREVYVKKLIVNGVERTSQVRFIILQQSLSVDAEAGDYLTFDGIKYNLLAAEADPANATWLCPGTT
jgi:hypothetical protein